MIRSPDMLLVCEGPSGRRLGERLGNSRTLQRSDPYQALLEMSRRRWKAVVLAGPRAGFEGFCRASRRLQPDARLYALCAPAGEADLRPLRGAVLDDYFIDPPTDEDLRRIARGDGAGGRERGASGAGLPAGAVARLVEATRTVEEVEGELAAMVGERIGGRTRWVTADAARPGEALLLTAADKPRALVVDGAAAEPDPQDRIFLAALQRTAGALIATARRSETLHRLAVTDYLTGAYNRRYFYHITDEVLSRQRGSEARVALLLFDIDNFKRYNDTYGHAAGDEVLCEAASLMKRVTREHDVVARIGGDEFAMLFWDAEPPRQPASRHPRDASEVATRFLQALSDHEFASLGPEARGVLTISGGLATFPWDGRTCRELLRHADTFLRQAKAAGKNAIYLVGQAPINGPGEDEDA